MSRARGDAISPPLSIGQSLPACCARSEAMNPVLVTHRLPSCFCCGFGATPHRTAPVTLLAAFGAHCPSPC